jgi:hypothetical protein
MDIEHIDPKRPDIRIQMTAEEADALYNMIVEGKAYAADCGESTEPHQTFLNMLEPMIVAY